MGYMKSKLIWFIRLLFISIFVWISIVVLKDEEIQSSFLQSFNWLSVIIVTVVYTSAFLLRALAWRIFLKGSITFKSSMVGIFYSFVFNHILPVKAGDFIRAGIVTLNHQISFKRSLSSVVTLRILDLGVLGIVAMIGAFLFGYHISTLLFFLFIVGGLLLVIVGLIFRKRFKWLNRGVNHLKEISPKAAVMIVSLTTMSWVFEGIVLFEIAKMFGSPLGYLQSVWVNSLTVAGQVFHFTPGGLGTYESVMTAVLASMSIAIKKGYSIALSTHLFKFILSFFIGIGLILWTPVPIHMIKKWVNRKGEQS
ncbi:lysylphosphatidylglycerol synthase transmembrane domain-containing protein [Pseudalkalibacillus berkeleyi]|uniref:Phosphatidylglycerol lysyltransferase n=1 Tax=Pseudalkalibacillus berkeleyi TaxID=1069813 RepID=A0ABS9H2K6_9BACL|nr:lysylphosphatidylglycerol synthase transmembrane domain-containing protein [Pseudalkalibacillus berkeleyi]MCF6138156.1 flippase-like domain-containing protein [Pseudalkalibacillus berkeleyi]